MSRPMSCPRCRELVDDHARLLAGGSFSAIVFVLLLAGQALLEPLAHALHAGSLRVLLGLVGALEHGAVRVGRQKRPPLWVLMECKTSRVNVNEAHNSLCRHEDVGDDAR